MGQPEYSIYTNFSQYINFDASFLSFSATNNWSFKRCDRRLYLRDVFVLCFPGSCLSNSYLGTYQWQQYAYEGRGLKDFSTN